MTTEQTTMPAFGRGLTGAFLLVTGLALSGCAGDQLASHAVNNISEGWYSWGTVKTDILQDPALQGSKVQRIAVTVKPAQPWDTGVVAPVVKPVKKGDVIVFAFWARAEVLPEGDDFIALVGRAFEQEPPHANITPESQFLVGRQWKLFHASGTAEKNYAAGKIAGGLLIGQDAQTIDFGPVYISDFGPKFDVSKLKQLQQ